MPSTGNPDPDVVLGQADLFGTLENRGDTASAATMSGPQSIATDGTRLVVADTDNNRVLVWDDISTVVTGDPADSIVGQVNGTTTTPNTGGISAATLDGPCGVAIDGTRLLICDRDNHRVLVFDDITALAAFGTSADLALGQTDFVSNLENRGSTVNGNTLASPQGVAVIDTSLYVVDTDNNRVVVWRVFPTIMGRAGDFVIGQNNLASDTATTGTSGLNGPRGLASDGERLLISDTGNNRVLFFDRVPFQSDASAEAIVGQGTFGASQPNQNNDEPGEETLFEPYGLFYNGVDLWIADQMNSRVVRFR